MGLFSGPSFWGSAPLERQTETDHYVITHTTRPPLADAGITRRTTVTGWSAVRSTQRAIRQGHGRVIRTERKRRWFG